MDAKCTALSFNRIFEFHVRTAEISTVRCNQRKTENDFEKRRRDKMRHYENPEHTSENRCAPRSYYIPKGISEYHLLNGEWRFAYFKRDIDMPEKIEEWDTIPVPSCWQLL